MKKILLIAVMAAVCAGCKKTETKKTDCRIVGLYNTMDSTLNELTYDPQGRLSVTVQGSLVTTYTYSDNSVVITVNNGGIFISRATAVLNVDGLAVNVYSETPQTGTAWRNKLNVYDGQQLVRSVFTTAQKPTPDTTTYQWSNGNLISSVQGKDTTSYAYDLDKPAQPGDYLSLAQMVQGYEEIRSKNVFSKLGDTRFTYEFGQDKWISSITTTYSGGIAYKTDYLYKCN
jgi:hypothetical protein